MDLFMLICFSLSLAADAFVTAVFDGLAYRPKPIKRIAIALSFGAMQGLMPILGAILGETTLKTAWVREFMAFAALFIVAVMMLIDGFEKSVKVKKELGAKTVAFQAFATSVDAFACGLSLYVLPFPLWFDGLAIGIITAAVCAIGIFFATAIGKRFTHPERFKLIGGFVLLAIAVKNLVYCFI